MLSTDRLHWRATGLEPSLRRSLLVFMGSAVAILVGAGLAGLGYSTTTLALLITLITAIPVVLNGQRLDLFAPWNYMFYFIILNVLVRSAFIDFQITGDVVDLNSVFFLDKPPQFMVESMGVALLGYSFLT